MILLMFAPHLKTEIVFFFILSHLLVLLLHPQMTCTYRQQRFHYKVPKLSHLSLTDHMLGINAYIGK